MSVQLDLRAIRQDRQHATPLVDAAEAVIARTFQYTDAPVLAARSDVDWQDGGPRVIVGGRGAGAVSVEFGTIYRYPSAPFRRAAVTVGLDLA